MSSFLSMGRFFDGEPRVQVGYDFLESSELGLWTKTAISSGDAAVASVRNGVLRATGAATTDNSGVQIQLTTCPVQLEANKNAQANIRMNLSSTDIEWLFGYGIVDTSAIATFPTGGIFLYKAERSTAISLISMHGGIQVTKVVGNIAAAGVYDRYGFQVRVKNDATQAEVVVHKNGTIVYGNANPNLADPLLDLASDVLLFPTFAMQSGSATGTQSIDIDYLKFDFNRYV